MSWPACHGALVGYRIFIRVLLPRARAGSRATGESPGRVVIIGRDRRTGARASRSSGCRACSVPLIMAVWAADLRLGTLLIWAPSAPVPTSQGTSPRHL
jgi:hypothetical protein